MHVLNLVGSAAFCRCFTAAVYRVQADCDRYFHAEFCDPERRCYQTLSRFVLCSATSAKRCISNFVAMDQGVASISRYAACLQKTGYMRELFLDDGWVHI